MSISTHYTIFSNELIVVWEEACKEHEYKVGHDHPGTHPQLLVPLVLCDGYWCGEAGRFIGWGCGSLLFTLGTGGFCCGASGMM